MRCARSLLCLVVLASLAIGLAGCVLDSHSDGPAADANTSAPAPTPTLPPTASAQSVGGSISGLVGSVVLQNNGGDTLALSTDGNFNFTTPLATGSTYAVSVLTQPATQTCTVANANGTIGASAVTNIGVVCSTHTASVGGTVSGLSGQLTVLNNGGDPVTLTGNGNFLFPAAIAQGSPYAVTLQTQPANQTCTVGNGSGTMGSNNIQNVAITCSTLTRTIGGTISGLSGQVRLQNNGADTLTLTSNGSFTFATPIAQGGNYAVTVLTQPAIQTCTVNNGSGTTGSSNITNVGLSCITNTTTLTVTSNGTIPVGSGSGSLLVSNLGANPALNVHATLPAGWAGVTQNASQCVSVPAGGNCTLTFTSTLPYVAQGNIAITADNVPSPPSTALAFTVGGYLVFAVPTASTATVIDAADLNSPQSWAPAGQSLSPGAQSLTNGAANSTDIVTAVTSNTVYAATMCYRNTASGNVSVGTWYLPALCQSEAGAGVCPAGTPNIETNLVQLGFGSLSTQTSYWTSTEPNSQDFAWAVNYQTSPAIATPLYKMALINVRCVREINY